LFLERIHSTFSTFSTFRKGGAKSRFGFCYASPFGRFLKVKWSQIAVFGFTFFKGKVESNIDRFYFLFGSTFFKGGFLKGGGGLATPSDNPLPSIRLYHP